MFSFLRPYKYVIDVALVLALVATFAFGVHTFALHNQRIGEDRVQAQWDRAQTAALEAQRLREIQFQKEKDDAVNQAQKSIQAANAGAAAAAESGRVLHSTIETILARSPGDPADATRKYTAALAAVLDQCQAAYGQMAKTADGHAIDSLTYQKAWPK